MITSAAVIDVGLDRTGMRSDFQSSASQSGVPAGIAVGAKVVEDSMLAAPINHMVCVLCRRPPIPTRSGASDVEVVSLDHRAGDASGPARFYEGSLKRRLPCAASAIDRKEIGTSL
jgi:hypothetical protein